MSGNFEYSKSEKKQETFNTESRAKFPTKELMCTIIAYRPKAFRRFDSNGIRMPCVVCWSIYLNSRET